MTEKYTMFIFRRDFRIVDNLGLNYAMKYKYYSYLFLPEQIRLKMVESDNAIQFMIESLKDLDSKLKKNSKLHMFQGENITVHKINIIKYRKYCFQYGLHTMYNKKRFKISAFCKSKSINCVQIEDYL